MLKKKRSGKPTAGRRAGKNKSDYISLRIVYLAKRNEIRSKYKYGDPAYKKAVRVVQLRIDSYNRAIKKFDDKKAQLLGINNKIKEYYGFSLYLSSTNWGTLVKSRSKTITVKMLIRKMFCKYCIESGIGNFYIVNFLGKDDRGAGLALRYRGELNKAIKTDEDVLKKWHQFKRVVNDKGDGKQEEVSKIS